MGKGVIMNIKRIICLANSRKYLGRCVAGKEVLTDGLGSWIRPVSARHSGEVSEEERRYENGRDPSVYDIIDIPLLKARPHLYQSENHLIDADKYWKKTGTISWEELKDLVDPSAPLWVNDDSSYNGINDRVSMEVASHLDHSLVLIDPQNLTIQVQLEGEGFPHPKRKVRADFTHHGAHYRLAVTDPVAERAFLARPNGVYPLHDAYLCISLGEEYQGSCYKLVATILSKQPL
jgi:hypothetical protein